jgi:hypothetical protein
MRAAAAQGIPKKVRPQVRAVREAEVQAEETDRMVAMVLLILAEAEAEAETMGYRDQTAAPVDQESLLFALRQGPSR